MDPHFKTVLSELDAAGIRTITLNRPDSLNAMNRQLIGRCGAGVRCGQCR